MKNKITLTFAIMMAGLSSAQIGVNTSNPRATLDITAKASAGTIRTPEGLIIPNVDRQRAQSMTGITTSTMIYVNSVSTGKQEGIAVNIDVAGYYYFNGTVWTKLIPEAPTFIDTDTSIYNTNGTLEGNRTVAQAGNTLSFTSTATTGTSHFTVDGNTFNVNAVNNRVGIGTNAPNSLLDLGISSGRKLAIWNSAAGDDFYGFGTGADVLQLYAGATSTQSPLITLNQNGRVGIGTTAPATNFHVIGTRRFENATAGSVAVGSVLTATDTNGTAEWKTPASETVPGGMDAGAGIDISFATNATNGIYRYTGRFITLPPGKWAVTITQLAHTSGTLDTDDWIFVRSTFAEGVLAIGAPATRSANVTGGPSLMSFRVQGPGTSGNAQQFDVYQGTIFINNNTNAAKTYRYIVGNTVTGGSPNSETVIKTYGGSWSESSIYATAIK